MSLSLEAIQIRAAAELALRQRRETERRSLTLKQFVSKVYPRYEWYRHCEVLANVLQRVADGKLKRVMIFMPPRGGKSQLTSKLFPAYMLYKYPQKWVGLNSYAAELAYTFSRSSRDAYRDIGGSLREDASAVKNWESPEGGGCWAAGVGGPITGKGFGSVGIIDDPLKNAEEALSERIRNKQKDWYGSTFYTRAEPDAAIVIVQCMTGDTSVLMANGTETPLREIKAGDRIATYDNGKLSTSTVSKHRSNGHDNIFKIIMINGTVVRANARHPFLVEEHGKLKWIRLKNLTTAHRIVTLKGSGGSGKVKTVLPTGAKSLLDAEASAMHTIKRKNGLMGIVLHRLVQRVIARDTLSIGTVLRLMSMMRCWYRKTVNALFVSNRLGKTCALIGVENYVLTTAMAVARLERFCATTAISLLDTPNQRQQRLLWLNTSDFTSEAIASIESDGIEEVFDIQVDRTENFIANGLVSHNTRWHEDDLSGWLLNQERSGEPENWHIVNFEAIKEEVEQTFPETCTVEPDWRSPGEALCPERFDAVKLNRIKGKVGTLFWSALYQQRPSPLEGECFKRSWWQFYQELPAEFDQIVQSWDCAFKETSKSDFVVGQVWGKKGAQFYLLDQIRARMDINGTLTAIRTLTAKHPRATAKLVEDKANGSAVIDLLDRELSGLIAVQPEGGKLVRAVAIAPYAQAGNVYLPDPTIAPWIHDYIEEFAVFPNGSHDDQVDATTQAINWLETSQTGVWGVSSASYSY